jgi:hypothetical protein
MYLMPDIKGKVIPKPDNERDILNMQFPNDEENQPLITGSGDISIFCGSCSRILCRNLTEGQVQNVVIRCNRCKSYNDINI